MTDKDVVTALKYCADINCNCEKCSLYVAGDDDCQCVRKLKLAAIDLINRTKLESKKYRGKCINQKRELALMNEQIARQKAENERLKGEMANVSAKTLKRFEKNIKDVKVTLGQTWEIQNAIKETLKEMVGDV